MENVKKADISCVREVINGQANTGLHIADRIATGEFGDKESIDGAIPGLGQRFSGDDFRDLLRPGVYAFFKDGLPIYVGSSYSILQRAAYKDHNATEARKECDEVFLFPCVSKEAAESLETFLIGKFRPRDNKAKRCSYVQDVFSVSGAAAWKILEDHGWRMNEKKAVGQ
jgi:hypothetical protein